jgi:hypothetical protein
MNESSQLAQVPIWVDALSKLAVPGIAFVGAVWRAGDLAAAARISKTKNRKICGSAPDCGHALLALFRTQREEGPESAMHPKAEVDQPMFKGPV